MREELEAEGTIFQTTMDSEIFVHLIAKYYNSHGTIEKAVAEACRKVKGAFSLLVLANNKMIAVKDPNGFRPLGIGRVGDHYVFASETCCL